MAFKHIEGETAVVASGGVYKQADLYDWNGKLFAKHGSGFVRLKDNGSTSKDGIQLIELQYEGKLYRDAHGRLCTGPGAERVVVPARIHSWWRAK